MNTVEEFGLLGAARDPQALERPVEPDVNVNVASVFVEMKERAGTSGEVTTLAFAQLRKLAQLCQETIYPVQVFVSRMPHGSSLRVNGELMADQQERSRRRELSPED